MTSSSLQSSLLPAVGVAGTIFAAATLPFVLYSSQVVELELQNQPVLSTELKYLSGPYLGITGAVSATVGLSILGLTGWRQAVRKTEAAEEKISSLQQDLIRHRSELEQIKFSKSRLQAKNLDAFLPEAPAASQAKSTEVNQDLAVAIAQASPEVESVEISPAKAAPTAVNGVVDAMQAVDSKQVAA